MFILNPASSFIQNSARAKHEISERMDTYKKSWALE